MKSLYIIKAGSTFDSEARRLGDFEDWVRRGLGDVQCPVTVVNAEGGEALPDTKLCAGVVVTGSHAMVTDNLPWSIAIERWIMELIAAKVPFLGICYGHQLLGRAAGGEVGYHPRGREVGTVFIEPTPEGERDPLFDGIPARFAAHVTHAQSVLRLPEGAVRLAFNDFEPHHAFRVGESAWGVQFHPEYTREIMQTYAQDEVADLEAAGEDAGALRDAVQDAPLAGRVLTNFASFVSRRL